MIQRFLCWLRGHAMCHYYPSQQRWYCRCGHDSETDNDFLERMVGW